MAKFYLDSCEMNATPPTPRKVGRSLILFASILSIHGTFCFGQSGGQSARTTTRPAKPESSHLGFVAEYIRDLAAVERIRAAGEKENDEDKQNGKLPLAGAVHSSTLFELELGSQVKMLRGMRLNAPFDELIPNISAFFEKKILLWRRMREISSAFIGGPKTGVDYGKLAAEMPEIRAKLDFIDQSLFEATPGVFATLINLKEDSKGHASHLIITKEERAGLISQLDASFGAKLDQKDPNYTVGAAVILKAYLNKDFKCAEEPWD
jgi:hypothetical protein